MRAPNASPVASLSFALLLAVSLAAGCASSAAPKDDTQDTILYTPPADASMPPVPRGAPVLAQALPPEPPLPAPGTLTRAELEALHQAGPGFALAQVQVRPVTDEDGALVGYAIASFSEGAARRLTPILAIGDVITHMNGIRIRRPEDYFAAWTGLQGASTITLSYLRGEAPMTSTWIVNP